MSSSMADITQYKFNVKFRFKYYFFIKIPIQNNNLLNRLYINSKSNIYMITLWNKL